jgi:four helix bundle protein
MGYYNNKAKDYTDELVATTKHFKELSEYPEFQESVKLAKQLLPHVVGHLPNTVQGSWADQLYRSATSISANISEGVGRMQKSQIIQFFRIARGSAFETIAHLSLSPVQDLDLSEHRKNYSELIKKIDLSLIRLIESI